MKPDIILHIGTEKTGSTSIQEFLRASKDSLSELEILFPESIGHTCHIDFTACALHDSPEHPIRNLLGLTVQESFLEFVKNIKRKLSTEIKNNSPSLIIISDEHINAHLSSVESLLAFKELCEEFGEIKSVIIYLRRQDDFRLSMFSQGVRSGNLSGFLKLGPLPTFKVIPYRLNYLQMLNNLACVFGKEVLIPRVYDRNAFLNNDICADFIDASGIDIPYIRETTGEKNKSIDPRIIKHLARISSLLKKINKNWAEKLRLSVIHNCEKIFVGSSIVLKKEIHQCYMAQFDEQNELIKKEYFSCLHEDANLFPNNHLISRESEKIYPDCSISWLRFLAKYIIGLVSGYTNFLVVGEPLASSQMKTNIQDTDDGIEGRCVSANCPICGTSYSLNISVHSREGKLCPNCGGSGRSQAIAYHVSKILTNSVSPLRSHKMDKSKKIVGLSDGKVYADILEKKYDYTNTFYHREPFLDISNPAKKFYYSFDLLITTEVFEHIIGPSINAFKGSFNILKPGGHIILTVPFINKGESIEHYGEDLIAYTSYKNNSGDWVAELEFNDGHSEVDENAKFHGGPGKTLEIRLFSRQRLLRELRDSGFINIEIHDENLPQYGINWGAASRVITAKKPFET